MKRRASEGTLLGAYAGFGPVPLKITINGKPYDILVESWTVLLDLLRERLGLNGTKKGCGSETFATLKSIPSIQAMYQIHRNLRAD